MQLTAHTLVIALRCAKGAMRLLVTEMYVVKCPVLIR